MAYQGRGCAYFSIGEPGRAVEDFGRAIALDPNDVQSLRNRAMAYINLGNPEKAIVDRDRLNELAPAMYSLTICEGAP